MTITVVGGQTATAYGDDTASVSVAFPSNVASGNLAVITCALYNASSRTFVAGDCTKTAGTATIGTIALNVQNTYLGNDGYYAVVIFSAPITGAGSLTFQVATNANSYSALISLEIHSDTTTSFSLEDSDTGTGSPGSSANLVTGNGVSAGAAIFVGGCSIGNAGAGLVAVEAAFTSQGENEDGAHIAWSLETRIVTTGTTDAAEWSTGLTWGSGASAALAVYKEVSSGVTLSGGGTFANFTGSGAGVQVAVALSGGGTFANFTGSGAGAKVAVALSGGGTFANFVGSGAGAKVAVALSGGGTFDNFAGSGAGLIHTATLSGGGTFDNFTGSGDGAKVAVALSGGGAFGDFTGSGAGAAVALALSGGSTFDNFTGSGAGAKVTVTLSGGGAFANFSGSGAGLDTGATPAAANDTVMRYRRRRGR